MAANYRAACRARSRAEFIAKLGTVVEESDESVYWLEYIVASGLLPPSAVAQQLDEARQLRSIFAASLGTSRDNYRRNRENSKRSKRTITRLLLAKRRERIDAQRARHRTGAREQGDNCKQKHDSGEERRLPR